MVLPILCGLAYRKLQKQQIHIDFREEVPYDCGKVTYKDLWMTGIKAVRGLQKDGYSATQNYQTGILTEAFNPQAEYAYYELTNLLPRWFLGRFPRKLSASMGYLEENSAYVSMYCIPPPMKFSSYAVYNLVRWNGTERDILGAELSRPINRLNMNRTGDGLVVMITSADVNTYEYIREKFIQSGVPETAFNFYAINPKLVRFYNPNEGIYPFFKSRPDILNFVFRRSIPEDLAEMVRYRSAKFPAWYVVPSDKQEKKPVDLPIINRPFEEKIYKAGGFGFEDFVDSPSDMHLKDGLERFEKAVIEYVQSKTGMKFKDADTVTPISHKAHQCILNESYIMMPPKEIYDLYGTLARCARVTDDCAIVHTRPTPDLRERGFAYKEGKLFVLIASNRKPLNVVYSSSMITQAVPELQNPHLTYENKENLVSWRDTALVDSSKIIGNDFDDFVISFSGKTCPENLPFCKSPKVSYPDGGLLVVERIYANVETTYGSRWNKVLPSRLLMFE